jgi:hypothetical protein
MSFSLSLLVALAVALLWERRGRASAVVAALAAVGLVALTVIVGFVAAVHL